MPATRLTRCRPHLTLFFCLQPRRGAASGVTQECGWCLGKASLANAHPRGEMGTEAPSPLLPTPTLGAKKAKTKVGGRLALRGTGSSSGQPDTGCPQAPPPVPSGTPRAARCPGQRAALLSFLSFRFINGWTKGSWACGLKMGSGLLPPLSTPRAPSPPGYCLCHPLWIMGTALFSSVLI